MTQYDDSDNREVEAVKRTSVSEALAERYAAPTVVVATLKKAGNLAAIRLLSVLEDDEKFSELSSHEQLKWIDKALEAAFGKGEAASAFSMTAAKTRALTGEGAGGTLTLSKQLENINDEDLPELTSAVSARDARDRVGGVSGPFASDTRSQHTEDDTRTEGRVPRKLAPPRFTVVKSDDFLDLDDENVA